MARNISQVVITANSREVERALNQGVADALKAHNRALNITGRKGAVQISRETATQLGVSQRPVRKRVRHYVRGPMSERELKLWVGLKAPLRSDEVGAKASKRLAKRTFRATMKSGKTADFIRVTPGSRWTAGRPQTSSPNLPIERPSVRLSPTVDPILKRVAARVGREVYPVELKKDYLKRINKTLAKAKRRR